MSCSFFPISYILSLSKRKGEKRMNKISKFFLVILCCTFTLTTAGYTSNYEIMPTDHLSNSDAEVET